ncbi:hypothetical protein BJ508DRAFT_419747 [Ascobolus immersus RN42]|uniref:Uncharacterized protein n=1 Tax=Ascobolus immersus RN42 TaxID=1160509 RepID=A0A3N4HBP3_ASCIM|nr:hypothetical protein BJ508DRAFT_419747 [Ascobolus immersus RN42]
MPTNLTVENYYPILTDKLHPLSDLNDYIHSQWRKRHENIMAEYKTLDNFWKGQFHNPPSRRRQLGAFEALVEEAFRTWTAVSTFLQSDVFWPDDEATVEYAHGMVQGQLLERSKSARSILQFYRRKIRSLYEQVDDGWDDDEGFDEAEDNVDGLDEKSDFDEKTGLLEKDKVWTPPVDGLNEKPARQRFARVTRWLQRPPARYDPMRSDSDLVSISSESDEDEVAPLLSSIRERLRALREGRLGSCGSNHLEMAEKSELERMRLVDGEHERPDCAYCFEESSFCDHSRSCGECGLAWVKAPTVSVDRG